MVFYCSCTWWFSSLFVETLVERRTSVGCRVSICHFNLKRYCYIKPRELWIYKKTTMMSNLTQTQMHYLWSKCKTKIKALPSILGFTVFGINHLWLNKIPKMKAFPYISGFTVIEIWDAGTMGMVAMLGGGGHGLCRHLLPLSISWRSHRPHWRGTPVPLDAFLLSFPPPPPHRDQWSRSRTDPQSGCRCSLLSVALVFITTKFMKVTSQQLTA